MTVVKVYVLLESDTERIRYVGITKHPLEHRLTGHLKDAAVGKARTRKISWIKALLARGAVPTIVQIDETDEADWQQVECDWIRYLRDDLGLDLVNGTDGGRGVVNPSTEERARRAKKMKETMTGRPKPWAGGPRDLSDASRKRMKAAALARPALDEKSRENIKTAAIASWERRRARSGEPCDCRRCVVRRKNPRTIAKQSQPKTPKRSNHTRYHVNRGLIKNGCFHCDTA